MDVAAESGEKGLKGFTPVRESGFESAVELSGSVISGTFN